MCECKVIEACTGRVNCDFHNLEQKESPRSPGCSIADIESYIQMRIRQADSQIATEVLAGNDFKEQAERSARAELVGLTAFIKNKQ